MSSQPAPAQHTASDLTPASSQCLDAWHRRRWLPVAAGAVVPADAWSVRALTYNVLAQANVRKEWYPYVNADDLRWKYRRGNLIDELADLDADIGFLQEVDHYDSFWKPQLARLGYDSHRVCRTGSKRDGELIYWRSDMFTLLHTDHALLDELADERHDEAFRRYNVAAIAVVVPVRRTGCPGQPPPPVLALLSCHLFWDPAMSHVILAQAQRVRQRLAHVLRSIAHKLPCRAERVPVIVGGDLNFRPGTDVLAAMCRADSLGITLHSSYAGYQDAADAADALASAKAKQGYQDAADAADALASATTTTRGAGSHGDGHVDGDDDKDGDDAGKDGDDAGKDSDDAGKDSEVEHPKAAAMVEMPLLGHPKYTNIVPGFAACIDHLLATQHFTPRHLLDIAPLQDCADGLPNHVYSSDHIALMADLAYFVV